MKKDLFNLKRSRWLFFSLFALLVGVSPAWADAYTCGFESSDGWAYERSSSWVYTITSCEDGWGLIADGKNLQISTTKHGGDNSLYTSTSNTVGYVVSPYLAAGTISFYGKRSDGSGYISIYKVEESDGSFELSGSPIAKFDKTQMTNTSSWFELSCELDEDSRIAILINYANIDDFSASNGLATLSGIAKPKSLAASNVGATSADITWTAGGEETAWELSYSTTSGDPDNGTIISLTETSYSLTGLTSETTYYVSVRAQVGEEYSPWTKEVSFTPSKAVKLTVNDGTNTNSYIPIYGNYVDAYDKVEFVIPAADLADMANSDIKALQFYMSTPAAASWGAANFKIYMKEVDYTTISSYVFTDDDTPLYNGAIDGTKSIMALDLTTPYHYDGGNLLIGVYNTAKGSYKSSYFYGVTATSGASAYGTSSTSLEKVTSVNKQSFLPKTTFTYLPVDGPVMKVSDTAFDFGTITAESAAEDKVKIFTISNKGNATLENISVSYSGDDVFTLSDDIATSIAEGGEDIEVSVTMSTTTPGDYSGTITISATDQTPVEIAVTGTYAANPATMAITLGEEAVGETIAFGNVGKQATKTFTVTNDGNLKLNISSITSSNTTDFTVSPATLEVAGGSSETFTVTFLFDEEAMDTEKTATITVTPSNAGIDPVSFTVTGTRIEQWSEDFSGNALPDGWEITNSTYWKIEDGVAKSTYSSSNYYLITPSLTVEEGASLSFDVRSVGTWNTLTIEKQLNNDSWTSCKDIYSNADFGNDTEIWKTFTIEGLEAGNYKFRFNARNFWLDNFEGFKRNMNDPKLGIYNDAECTDAIATSVTKDFDFATETPQPATYYIKNDGTGTMTLSLGDAPDGFTASLDKTNVAAGEHATLTITMPAEDNKGYHSGNVVVTATDLGTFTVAVSGVIVDENKMNLDFTTDNIPAAWTTDNNKWSKNASGYVEVGYSGSPVTMQTSNLTAEAGEELVVVAKMSNTYSSYSFGVKYKNINDEEWSDLIPASNIGTSYVTLHGTIAEAGTYQLQFNGQYTQIKRIYGLETQAVAAMTTTAANHAFGMQTAESEEWSFTISNEGDAPLNNLSVALAKTGDEAEYSFRMTDSNGDAFTATTLAAGATITVYVKQLFDVDNLGAKSDQLTIAGDGQETVTVNLSGTTRDPSKLYVDFDDPNSFPAGWQAGANWNVSTYGTDRNAYQNGSTATALVTTPLTVAENETLTFKVARYSSGPSLQIRYSQDGGVTWSDYTTYYTSDEGSSAYTTKTIEGIPAGTTILEFLGKNIKLDAIEGFGIASAPVIALTESGKAVANGSTKSFGTLTSKDATATYTLSNTGTADMVSTLAVSGNVTMNVTAMDEGVSQNESTLTIPAGKTATVVVTMPYAEPYSAKSGTLTITTEGWVGTMTVNFTGSTVDPTAIALDFADNKRPEGWYVSNNGSGFLFTSGNAKNSLSEQSMITEKMSVSGADDVLTYDAAKSGSWYTSSLTVSYSTDRVNWTVVSEPELTTTDLANFEVKGLAAGEYYLQFKGAYVVIDNIIGWHKVTPAPEHDLYLAGTSIPTETVVPESSYTATVDVASLRADETVTAQLWIQKGEEEAVKMAELTEQTISNGATKTFTLTGTMPAAEDIYKVWATVYNDDATVTTDKMDIEVAHTHTLQITDFALTSDAEVVADENNQFTATFDVTVQNTGSVAYAPTVKVKNGDTVIGTATAEVAVEAGQSTTLTVTAENVSAGEGGELSFTAAAYWDETEFAYATPVAVNAVAAAPKFNLAVKDGDALSNGDDVAYAVVTEATTKTFTITNSGNAALELVSIVAPEGYEATAVTEENKTIAVNGTLDINVTLKAEQGKKSGDLVITYKVDAQTDNTFTLALSGRSIAADTWTAAFNDYAAAIPAGWTNNGWSIAGEYNDYPGAAYSYDNAATLMTPRLAAAEGEELTFDVVNNYYGTATYAYSQDKVNWSDEQAITGTGEKSFVAPAAGNYYIRFTGRGAYIQNFVGFKLNTPEHDTEIAASSVPATGQQYATYTATVTLKENAGKDEAIVAKLMVDGADVEANVDVTTAVANASTVVTLTWTPQTAIDAKKAFVEISYEGGTLTTDEIDLTIAAAPVFDEANADATVASGDYASLVLKHTFVQGWNTICLPFDVAVTDIHADAVAYAFTGYNKETKVLTFTKATELTAGYPYVIYVPADISEDYIFLGKSISSLDETTTPRTFNDVTFHGTYAPMAAGTLVNKFGLTAAGKIVAAKETTTMKGFRGYFEGVPAGARVSFFGDEATGIRTIEVDITAPEGSYNLNGQKVDKLNKSGLYIINGKKVVIK